MEERMHNANEATTNALGHTQRTSHQENLVPTKTMGALIVSDLKTGVVFNIGTGFDDATRDWWWNHPIRERSSIEIMNDLGMRITFTYPDIIVKYKHFAVGAKDKPRFPAYIGIRDKSDM
jgi:DNA ligase-1